MYFIQVPDTIPEYVWRLHRSFSSAKLSLQWSANISTVILRLFLVRFKQPSERLLLLLLLPLFFLSKLKEAIYLWCISSPWNMLVRLLIGSKYAFLGWKILATVFSVAPLCFKFLVEMKSHCHAIPWYQ